MDVYLVDFLRTAFSRSKPKEPEKDAFNTIRMDEALAMLIKEVVRRSHIDPEKIGDVITGCAMQADENWLFGGRHPVLLAGLPVSVPGAAVDRACSSSMMAIAIGAWEISSGDCQIVLAGGMEHMTHVPMVDTPFVKPNIKLLVRPEYLRYLMSIGYNMGLTAEKLAQESGIGREKMDGFSLRSHKLAAQSYDAGWFEGEIFPVQVEHDGQTMTIDRDQSVRYDASIEQMAALPPAFKPDGLITAGNSSPMNTGASLVMLTSEKMVEEYSLKPLARIRSFAWAGVDPSTMGQGPVPATKKALHKAGLSVENIDFWEINEAFAVVPLYAVKELGLDVDRVNVHGGAVAIGHPLGATGARITGTLARTLQEKKANLGAATLCVGGGQGFTIILERV